MKMFFAWAALLLAGAPAVAADARPVDFSAEEVARIVAHGPWPPPLARDAGNRVSGRPAAIEFGAQLFFDPRLSANGQVSCASCHRPQHGWSEPRATTAGLEPTERNSKSVVDARFNRWFGWSGASDSLWAASLRPLADPREMGGVERRLPALVRDTPDLACGYRRAFNAPPPADDEQLFADLGKALAAFQETLVSGRTSFDDFRDALARGDRRAAARYPLAAQRGLKLFVGRAGCSTCHFGPTFSNGEFDTVGIAVRNADGRFDWGRYDGIKALQSSRFNLLGRYNDDATRANAVATQHVRLDREAYGAFKVPALRNVALTAPYMHNGSLATLADVVRHYSTIDDVKLAIALSAPHHEPEGEFVPTPVTSVLRTLDLTDGEVADLVAFLETLTEKQPRRVPPLPKALCR